MTFLYPNPVLQMKHSFWRINLYVICRSGYRSRCKACAQKWSFLADWKRLMLQKVFQTVFDVLVTHEVFLSLTVFAFEGKKMLYSSVTTGNFFFSQAAIIFADQFLRTCPQKNNYIANWLLLLKKRLKN